MTARRDRMTRTNILFIIGRILIVFIFGFIGLRLIYVGQELTAYMYIGWTLTAFTYLLFGVSLAKDADR